MSLSPRRTMRPGSEFSFLGDAYSHQSLRRSNSMDPEGDHHHRSHRSSGRRSFNQSSKSSNREKWSDRSRKDKGRKKDYFGKASLEQDNRTASLTWNSTAQTHGSEFRRTGRDPSPMMLDDQSAASAPASYRSEAHTRKQKLQQPVLYEELRFQDDGGLREAARRYVHPEHDEIGGSSSEEHSVVELVVDRKRDCNVSVITEYTVPPSESPRRRGNTLSPDRRKRKQNQPREQNHVPSRFAVTTIYSEEESTTDNQEDQLSIVDPPSQSSLRKKKRVSSKYQEQEELVVVASSSSASEDHHQVGGISFERSNTFASIVDPPTGRSFSTDEGDHQVDEIISVSSSKYGRPDAPDSQGNCSNFGGSNRFQFGQLVGLSHSYSTSRLGGRKKKQSTRRVSHRYHGIDAAPSIDRGCFPKLDAAPSIQFSDNSSVEAGNLPPKESSSQDTFDDKSVLHDPSISEASSRSYSSSDHQHHTSHDRSVSDSDQTYSSNDHHHRQVSHDPSVSEESNPSFSSDDRHNLRVSHDPSVSEDSLPTDSSNDNDGMPPRDPSTEDVSSDEGPMLSDSQSSSDQELVFETHESMRDRLANALARTVGMNQPTEPSTPTKSNGEVVPDEEQRPALPNVDETEPTTPRGTSTQVAASQQPSLHERMRQDSFPSSPRKDPLFAVPEVNSSNSSAEFEGYEFPQQFPQAEEQQQPQPCSQGIPGLKGLFCFAGAYGGGSQDQEVDEKEEPQGIYSNNIHVMKTIEENSDALSESPPRSIGWFTKVSPDPSGADQPFPRVFEEDTGNEPQEENTVDRKISKMTREKRSEGEMTVEENFTVSSALSLPETPMCGVGNFTKKQAKDAPDNREDDDRSSSSNSIVQEPSDSFEDEQSNFLGSLPTNALLRSVIQRSAACGRPEDNAEEARRPSREEILKKVAEDANALEANMMSSVSMDVREKIARNLEPKQTVAGKLAIQLDDFLCGVEEDDEEPRQFSVPGSPNSNSDSSRGSATDDVFYDAEEENLSLATEKDLPVEVAESDSSDWDIAPLTSDVTLRIQGDGCGGKEIKYLKYLMSAGESQQKTAGQHYDFVKGVGHEVKKQVSQARCDGQYSVEFANSMLESLSEDVREDFDEHRRGVLGNKRSVSAKQRLGKAGESHKASGGEAVTTEVVQKTYQDFLNAIVRIQGRVRKMIAVRTYHLRIGAVLRLQAAARKMLAMQLLARIKDNMRMNGCALCIQTHFRRSSARKQYTTILTSTILIQTCYRRSRVHLPYVQAKKCAVIVQAHYRRFLAVECYRVVRKAAILIQTYSRRWLAMEHTSLQEKRLVAIVVQSMYRKSVAVAKYEEAKKSAIVIQSHARRLAALNTFSAAKSCIVSIQTAWRCHAMMRQFRNVRSATISVQSRARARQQVRIYAETRRAGILIQTFWRRVFAQRCYKKSMAGVLSCQSLARGWLARISFHRAYDAIVTIQAHERRRQARKALRAARIVWQIETAFSNSTNPATGPMHLLGSSDDEEFPVEADTRNLINLLNSNDDGSTIRRAAGSTLGESTDVSLNSVADAASANTLDVEANLPSGCPPMVVVVNAKSRAALTGDDVNSVASMEYQKRTHIADAVKKLAPGCEPVMMKVGRSASIESPVPNHVDVSDSISTTDDHDDASTKIRSEVVRETAAYSTGGDYSTYGGQHSTHTGFRSESTKKKAVFKMLEQNCGPVIALVDSEAAEENSQASSFDEVEYKAKSGKQTPSQGARDLGGIRIVFADTVEEYSVDNYNEKTMIDREARGPETPKISNLKGGPDGLAEEMLSDLKCIAKKTAAMAEETAMNAYAAAKKYSDDMEERSWDEQRDRFTNGKKFANVSVSGYTRRDGTRPTSYDDDSDVREDISSNENDTVSSSVETENFMKSCRQKMGYSRTRSNIVTGDDPVDSLLENALDFVCITPDSVKKFFPSSPRRNKFSTSGDTLKRQQFRASQESVGQSHSNSEEPTDYTSYSSYQKGSFQGDEKFRPSQETVGQSRSSFQDANKYTSYSSYQGETFEGEEAAFEHLESRSDSPPPDRTVFQHQSPRHHHSPFSSSPRRHRPDPPLSGAPPRNSRPQTFFPDDDFRYGSRPSSGQAYHRTPVPGEEDEDSDLRTNDQLFHLLANMLVELFQSKLVFGRSAVVLQPEDKVQVEVLLPSQKRSGFIAAVQHRFSDSTDQPATPLDNLTRRCHDLGFDREGSSNPILAAINLDDEPIEIDLESEHEKKHNETTEQSNTSVAAKDGTTSVGAVTELFNEENELTVDSETTRQQLSSELREATNLMTESENPETQLFWRNHVLDLQRRLHALHGESHSSPGKNPDEILNENRGFLNQHREHYSPPQLHDKPQSSSSNMVQQGNQPRGHDTPDFDSPSMVDVISPADLPGGYHFEAEIEGQRFLATVPPGGVQKGETFSCVMRELDSVAVDIPVGYWKDGLADPCKYGCWHASLFNAFFCPLIALAQIGQRIQLDFLGRVKHPDNDHPYYSNRTMMVIVIAFWLFVNLGLLGGYAIKWSREVELSFADYSALALINLAMVGFTVFVSQSTRYSLREKFMIREERCYDLEDVVCSTFCLPCVVGQMHRHTANYDEYEGLLCSKTGLPDGVGVHEKNGEPTKQSPYLV